MSAHRRAWNGNIDNRAGYVIIHGLMKMDNAHSGMKQMEAGLLIFDLDGTLIDSSRDIAWSANETLEAMGHGRMESSRIISAIGWGVTMLLEQLMPGEGPDRIALAREKFLDIYGGHLTVDTVVYPGVVETLEHFFASGKRMAVVTNKPEALSRRALEELGLAGYFAMVVGGDTLPERKPAPAPLLKVMEGLGCGPSATVMVGDSPVDCEAARSANVRAIAVSYGFRPAVELEGACFDAMVDTFPALKDVII